MVQAEKPQPEGQEADRALDERTRWIPRRRAVSQPCRPGCPGSDVPRSGGPSRRRRLRCRPVPRPRKRNDRFPARHHAVQHGSQRVGAEKERSEGGEVLPRPNHGPGRRVLQHGDQRVRQAGAAGQGRGMGVLAGFLLCRPPGGIEEAPAGNLHGSLGGVEALAAPGRRGTSGKDPAANARALRQGRAGRQTRAEVLPNGARHVGKIEPKRRRAESRRISSVGSQLFPNQPEARGKSEIHPIAAQQKEQEEQTAAATAKRRRETERWFVVGELVGWLVSQSVG
mmetsp:Transcript_24337/g.49601  ORF Transcript_24337/g.49601 Transcript_24337/m.49601 type:complete len:283 (-) Transcript_24337:1212-2060(-)